MKTMRLLPIALAATAAVASAQQPDGYLDHVKQLLTTTPLIDGHNDLPWAIREYPPAPKNVAAYGLPDSATGHTDIPRLRKGMVGAQFWSVYIPWEMRDSGYAKIQLEQIDIARRFIDRYPGTFALARSASDIERIFGEGRIASLLGLEGGHAIENSLGALRAYYDLGARYMTLTHFRNIDWADSGTDSVRLGGLSAFGKEVVREMNRLGMLVDLSHTSPGTMSDALTVSAAPVIFSHSSARALVDHPRNVPDSILVRVRQNRGIVMVTFVPSFDSKAVRTWNLRSDSVQAALQPRFGSNSPRVQQALAAWRQQNPEPRATIADVADHIDHVRQIAGVDCVGIGSDFDGIESTPVGLEDVSTFPALFAELARRGWSDADLRKLAGENLLRVMREAEAVARRLQRERLPSVKTIEALDGR